MVQYYHQQKPVLIRKRQPHLSLIIPLYIYIFIYVCMHAHMHYQSMADSEIDHFAIFCFSRADSVIFVKKTENKTKH